VFHVAGAAPVASAAGEAEFGICDAPLYRSSLFVHAFTERDVFFSMHWSTSSSKSNSAWCWLVDSDEMMCFSKAERHHMTGRSIHLAMHHALMLYSHCHCMFTWVWMNI